MPKHLDAAPKGYILARNQRLTRIRVRIQDSWASAYFRIQASDVVVFVDKRRRVWAEQVDSGNSEAQARSIQSRIGSRRFQPLVALTVLLSFVAGSLAWWFTSSPSSTASAKSHTSVATIRQSKTLTTIQQSRTLSTIQQSKAPLVAANYCLIAPSSVRFEDINTSKWHSLGGLRFATFRLACAKGHPEVTVLANVSQRSILSLVQSPRSRG